MERLTAFNGGIWGLSMKAVANGYDRYSVFSRLAEYEDTGLTPEEIMKLGCELVSLEEINHNNVTLAINQIAEINKQLKAYRVAEEQGLLIKLPCKPGTKIYSVWDVEGRIPVIDEDYVGLRFIIDNIEKFGKTVFLTREAAEEALKGSVSE